MYYQYLSQFFQKLLEQATPGTSVISVSAPNLRTSLSNPQEAL